MPRGRGKTRAEVLVERLHALFSARRAWTVAELEAEGVQAPLATLRRRSVVAHLGARRMMVRPKRNGAVLVAEPLGDLRAPCVRPEAVPAPHVPDVDEYYYLSKEANLVRRLLELREPVRLVGPTGCGKSSLLRRLLREVVSPGAIFSVSLHGEVAYDDFFGTKELSRGRTYFRPGPVLLAMRQRRPLLIEELDVAPPEVLFSLQTVAGKEPVTLPIVGGRGGVPLVLNPWVGEGGEAAGEFVLSATCNTHGRGDTLGIYRGTQVQNAAFLNRWCTVELDYPPPEEEAKILVERYGTPPQMAEKIVKVAEMARSAARAEQLLTPFSVRNSINWARYVMLLDLTPDAAFRLAVLEAALPEERKGLSEAFQRVFGRMPVEG